jgi:hypothetical protein
MPGDREPWAKCGGAASPPGGHGYAGAVRRTVVDIDLPHGGTEGSNPAVSLLRTAPAIRKVQFARKLEMLEAALSSWREGEGGCRQSDPGSPYLSYPFINFSQ